jgi:hypothetical protein
LNRTALLAFVAIPLTLAPPSCSPHSQSADSRRTDHAELNAQDSIVCRRDLPRFDEYSAGVPLAQAPLWPHVTVGPDSVRADVALAGHAGGPPNFAAYLAVVEWGCGSPCQEQAVVNLRTGRVVSVVNTGAGASYHLGSRLLVANPPDVAGCYDPRSAATQPEFYVFNGDSLELIWTWDTTKIVDPQARQRLRVLHN